MTGKAIRTVHAGVIHLWSTKVQLLHPTQLIDPTNEISRHRKSASRALLERFLLPSLLPLLSPSSSAGPPRWSISHDDEREWDEDETQPGKEHKGPAGVDGLVQLLNRARPDRTEETANKVELGISWSLGRKEMHEDSPTQRQRRPVQVSDPVHRLSPN
jgi:hypothetical protein